jgi:Neuraminidase (sialidase)
MVFSKSSDGGETWNKPMPIIKVNLGNGGPPNTKVGADNYPAIGVDNSNGAHAGNLYVVMYNWTGVFMQVQVVRSTDGGNTWSKPVPVAPGITHDQFFPWLSVSPTGLVGVSWLDRRNDPNNVDYQAFAAISSDGGESFQPNVLLTKKFSNPNNNGSPGNRWMGDYSGNTWDGPNYFIAAWMDSSNGVDMQEEVGGIRLK